MRTFRLPLIGAAVLSLLLGTASLAVAAPVTIPGGGAEFVTGALVDPVHVSGPEAAPGLPGVMQHKLRYSVEWDSDVPLPDSAIVVMNDDLHFMAGAASTRVCWGQVVFEDKNGYMVGPFRGYIDDLGQANIQAMVQGGGDYAGLNAILNGPLGSDQGGPFAGLLFEGFTPRSSAGRARRRGRRCRPRRLFSGFASSYPISYWMKTLTESSTSPGMTGVLAAAPSKAISARAR